MTHFDWYAIVALILWAFTLRRIPTMTQLTDALDALEAAETRLDATLDRATTLIDTLATAPAAGGGAPASDEDIAGAVTRLTAVSGKLDTANQQLDAIVSANQPKDVPAS